MIVDFQRLRTSEAEDPFNRGGIIREGAARYLPGTRVVTLGHTPTDEAVRTAIDAARGVSTITLLTRDAADFPYQVEIARRVIEEAHDDVRIIHVALRGPYDTGILGPVSATLLTFGDPAVSLHALVDLLAGYGTPSARIPVQLTA